MKLPIELGPTGALILGFLGVVLSLYLIRQHIRNLKQAPRGSSPRLSPWFTRGTARARARSDVVGDCFLLLISIGLAVVGAIRIVNRT
jgi:hypothetical protein